MPAQRVPFIGRCSYIFKIDIKYAAEIQIIIIVGYPDFRTGFHLVAVHGNMGNHWKRGDFFPCRFINPAINSDRTAQPLNEVGFRLLGISRSHPYQNKDFYNAYYNNIRVTGDLPELLLLPVADFIFTSRVH